MKRTRYGLRLMVELARNFDKGPISLREIAATEDISEKYLEQIVIHLKTTGLVIPVRGPKGGYMLSAPPSQVILGSLFDLFEGSSGIAECVKKPSACERVDFCATRKLWEMIEEKIYETLNSMTLQDLVAASPEDVKGLNFKVKGRKRVARQEHA